nr:hypothetical protein [Kibdelosporangium sp. MJ126-NF4]
MRTHSCARPLLGSERRLARKHGGIALVARAQAQRVMAAHV